MVNINKLACSLMKQEHTPNYLKAYPCNTYWYTKLPTQTFIQPKIHK